MKFKRTRERDRGACEPSVRVQARRVNKGKQERKGKIKKKEKGKEMCNFSFLKYNLRNL